jgi:hypothetical protein
MMSFQRSLARLGLALLIISAAAGTVRAEAVTDQNVATAMQAAKAPADFQALATYFQAQAQQATANAARHQAMMDVFSHSSGRSQPSWSAHCLNLLKSYKEQAQDYAALATAYEKLAAGGAAPAAGKE